MAQVEDICQARIGTTLKGKWTLEKLLGTGGMAAVYVGVHKIGRRDAIKILHPEVAASPDLKARFEREAETTNRFCHPGAVEIRDFDVSDDGCPFLVMELLEGESLGERARRLGDIPVHDILTYFDELCDVLTAAHREGIIHRDVKLDNLFVTTDGKLKVLDFGIARVRSGPQLTMSGARLGTTAYMPPEQIRGGEIDARADLFAAGATMFRLLAKQRIHEAPTESELVIKMASEPAPKLRSVAPHVSEHVAAIVDRALEFHAIDRYPNALTMQEDVRSVRAGKPPAFAMARLAAGSQKPSASAFTAFEPTGVQGASASFATDATRSEGRDTEPQRAPSAAPRRLPPRPTMQGAPRPTVSSATGSTAGPSEITQAAPPPRMTSQPTQAIGLPPPRPPSARPDAWAAAPTSHRTAQMNLSERPATPPTAPILAMQIPVPPSTPPSATSTPMPPSFGSPASLATPLPASFGHSASPATPMSMAVPAQQAQPISSPPDAGYKSSPPPSVGAPQSTMGGLGGAPSYGMASSGPYTPHPGFAAPYSAQDPQSSTPWQVGVPHSNARKSSALVIAAGFGVLGLVLVGGAGGYYYLNASASVSPVDSSKDSDDSSASAKDTSAASEPTTAPTPAKATPTSEASAAPQTDSKTSAPSSPSAAPVGPLPPPHPATPAKPPPQGGVPVPGTTVFVPMPVVHPPDHPPDPHAKKKK